MSRQNAIQGDCKYRDNDMQETPVVLRDYKYIDQSLPTDYLSSIAPGIITEVRTGRGDNKGGEVGGSISPSWGFLRLFSPVVIQARFSQKEGKEY